MKDLTAICWQRALWHAGPLSLFMLSLFYYWFAVADRYAIFLYGHLDAMPFDELTNSRYCMAGLVASGAVMVIYALANWLLGWIATLRQRSYRPAALLPGSWAAQRPVDLTWLAMDGAGLMPVLLLVHLVELPSRNPSVAVSTAYSLALGALLASAVWLGVMTILRAWRRRPSPNAGAILAAGLCLSYLLMPLLHHLLLTPPAYRYITASGNFLAASAGLQLLVLLLAVLLALGTVRLRGAARKLGNKEAVNA